MSPGQTATTSREKYQHTAYTEQLCSSIDRSDISSIVSIDFCSVPGYGLVVFFFFFSCCPSASARKKFRALCEMEVEIIEYVKGFDSRAYTYIHIPWFIIESPEYVGILDGCKYLQLF